MNAVQGIEYSPLFSFFNLYVPYGNDIKLFKDNLILVQYMENKEFREERKETLIGRLMNGTTYEEYALENKILDKNNDFLGRKSGTARFSFAFIFKGNTYGVWNDYKMGKVFISSDFIPESPYIFSMSLEDSKPNIMMIKALKRYKFWRNFLDNFSLRCSVL